MQGNAKGKCGASGVVAVQPQSTVSVPEGQRKEEESEGKVQQKEQLDRSDGLC